MTAHTVFSLKENLGICKVKLRNEVCEGTERSYVKK